MTWIRTGNKPLSEPMLTRFIDAYMRHYVEMSYDTCIDCYQKRNCMINYVSLSLLLVRNTSSCWSLFLNILFNVYLRPPHAVVSIMMTSSNGNIFRVTGLLCGNSPVTGEIPTQRPATRSFDVFFDLRLNNRLSKQSWGWWFETPSCSLWRHSNVTVKLCKSDGVSLLSLVHVIADVASVCYKYIQTQ